MNEPHAGPARISPQARVALFGHEPTPASVELVPRGRRWRAFRALRVLAVALVVAPIVGLVPPHAPWALGALVGGGLLAWRRWQERQTLVGLEGTCPRCGAGLSVDDARRLRRPHPVACEACHHEAALVIEADVTAG